MPYPRCDHYYRYPRPALAFLAGLLLPTMLTGCLGLSGGSELIPPEASGLPPSEIAIGTGLNPLYSWQVGNISSLLLVRVADPLAPVWGIAAQGARDILASPVRHGLPPTDPSLQAVGSTEAVLTAGVEYSVIIVTQGGFKQLTTRFRPPYGNIATAINFTPFSAPAANHSIALKKDYTIWNWGANGSGQLGDGTFSDRSVPEKVTLPSVAAAVAAGELHTLANLQDGTVWAWGDNGSGQLGTGNTTPATAPIQIALPTGKAAASVAAGYRHSLAILRDGTLMAWGENSSGQLGDGTTTNRTQPVSIAGPTVVTAATAGLSHSLALDAYGIVWSWGANDSGQLGYIPPSVNPPDPKKPAAIPYQNFGSTAITAIASGKKHNLALASDGSVWAWGDNSSGQLGTGDTTPSPTPVKITGLGTITAIAAGENHSLALDSNGAVWAWGDNGGGQLGDGTSAASSPTPIKVTLSATARTMAIAGGKLHSLAVLDDDTVWAWGTNSSGQLGNDSMVDSAKPVQVSIP